MRHAAVVFPGMGYTHAYPILHLAGLAMEQVGATVERVTYPVVAEWAGQDQFWTAEREARFYRDARDDVRRVLDARPERLTLIGKSLGSHMLAALVAEPELPERTEAIWLTPVLGEDNVLEGARRSRWRSLFVVGTDDPAHHPDRQASVPGEVLELPGNHSLEVEGDIVATVDNYRRLTQTIVRFLDP
jgi:hypothetical protein